MDKMYDFYLFKGDLSLVPGFKWGLFCSFFLDHCVSFFFWLAIVLSVLLRFMASYYPFGVFKLFLNRKQTLVLTVWNFKVTKNAYFVLVIKRLPHLFKRTPKRDLLCWISHTPTRKREQQVTTFNLLIVII